ncbi:MAG TPA: prepilin-type N-terminal cleavage/methylation domain-containing protein [Candidatus Rifleibacterium sp.]|nr:prepilin-type N-terminal cleavage/methylation domain-containing protein [Candidatus Rifleibacterium sp.]HPT45121.1 prepilin-type N-terminal cleavage/methylation domain-containing protein [Candidatus Rifleibacterium sp.]
MKLRFLLLAICLVLSSCLVIHAEKRIISQQIAQQTNIQADDQTNVDFQQTDDRQINDLQVINSSENPDFVKPHPAAGLQTIGTVKSLVPYEDLYKVLQQDAGKYFILPIEEFEALKKAKEAWLASATAPVADPPPLLYQVNNARISGRLEENFAFIDATFKIDTFTDNWHDIPLFWGSLAVEAVTLDDRPTTLRTSWSAGQTRQVQFGKMNRQNMLLNVYNTGGTTDTLSQNNWKDAMFVLPVQGKGTHVCKVSLVVPIQNIDDLFTLQFSMTRIPLSFMQLKAADFVLSVDSTTFKDFSVAESAGSNGCEFIGWLGANSDISIKWRRKFSRQPAIKPLSNEPQPEIASATASAPAEVQVTAVEPVRPVVQPLVYARSQTLVSLGETSVYVHKTFDYTISKAPVSSFSFNVPEDVEIVAVNADRPQSQKLLREGNHKRLRVDFSPGREDVCQIEIDYEAPIDLTSKLISLPEVSPAGVERELGTIAVEALTSVEVKPGNLDDNPLIKGVYPLDQLEIPQPLKDRATRPLLLAWRQNVSPANIMLALERYLDVPQQTVVADSMDVKTTFTTNKSSNTLVSMNIRNNNKQYLQLQLASGSEVLSTFRGGVPVRTGNGKIPGVVQIPLEMSQTVGEPVEMNLQIIIKEPVDSIKWQGSLAFTPPLVDIPVSHFSWYLYAPEDYYLYGFSGTVKDPQTRKDPFFFRGFMRMLTAAWSLIRHPDTIVFIFFTIIVIMAIVARNLLFTILGFLWAAICGIFGFVFGGKGFRLIELMIVIIIIGVLAAMAIPNFRKAREQARDKACYANQRVLLGAVEMFNMDNPNKMANLDVDRLVQEKYLKNKPYPPENACRYFSQGNIGEDGFIYCQLHGPIEGDLNQANARREMANEFSEAKRADTMDQAMAGAAAMQVQSAPQAPPPMESGKASFGGAKARGMLPIKTKFVMTKNFYTLERDLVMAEVASDGALLANATCPTVQLSYIWTSVLKSAEIIAFILAMFGALYFVAGAFMFDPAKIFFSGLIIFFLSIIDLRLKTIGDAANAGFWLAIAGAFIWKAIWLVTNMKPMDAEIPPPPPATPQLNPETPPNAGRTNPMFLILLAVTIFLLGCLPVFAADYREIRVMAPFQDLSKVMPSGDRAVIIPEADYRYLKDIEPPMINEIIAPAAYSFEGVKYRGIIEERGVRFNAEFKLNLFNTGWKKVGLLSTEAIPSSASLNDEPLPLTLIEDRGETAYGFMTNASGPAMVTVEFFIPMASSEYRHSSRFNLNMVPVCISTLQITVNEKDCEAWIDPGVLRNSEKSPDKTVFFAILPPTETVNFELYRNITAPEPEEIKATDQPAVPENEPVIIEEKTRVTVRQQNLLHFKEGFVSGINIFDLKIMGGTGIASITFQIPEKIRVLKVENKLIENWRQFDADGIRRIEVIFKSRIRGNTQLTIEFEEDIQNLKDGSYQVPEIIPLDVEQSWGLLGIGCIQALDISVSGAPEGYSLIVAAEFLKDWTRERPEKTPYAFKFLRHPNELSLTIARPEDIEQQTAVIDRAEAMTLLNEEGYLLTRVVYEVRNNSEQFLKVKLPQIGDATTELWSTQVAGLSVRSGFDSNLGVYNLPIVRSPIDNGESKAFPVEIVFAIKLGRQLAAFNKTYMELPSSHLPISELSWVVYLPEGYELMRETGNVDRLLKVADNRFLDNSGYFSPMSSYSNVQSQKRQKSQSQNIMPQRQSEKVFGQSGLLPVKFKIPTTSWPIYFSMLQIEPTSKAPYIEGMLINPRKGRGFLFQFIMILVGIIAATGLIKMFTSVDHYKWFIITAIQGVILAIAVYLKLYQADHFVQLGFSATLVLYLLYRFFTYKPATVA